MTSNDHKKPQMTSKEPAIKNVKSPKIENKNSLKGGDRNYNSNQVKNPFEQTFSSS